MMKHLALASSAILAITAISVCAKSPSAVAPADAVYRNGYVYTIDTQDSVKQAIAIRDGKLVYVGNDAGALPFVGPHTAVTDLHGRMLMPGLVDGHMHPLSGGTVLLQCNLNYARLTVADLQRKIQVCLDATSSAETDKWLEVANWFQEAMIPNGVSTTRETLDALKTKRPILVQSSFGHTSLANSRALMLAHVARDTPDPAGGKVEHDASGNPTGILQDAAQELVRESIPESTPAEQIKAAVAALNALGRQGVTTFLDAAASPQTLAAFAGAQKVAPLTARAHFAIVITPAEAHDPKKSVAAAKALATRYDQGGVVALPGITVRNIKMFMDGVITAPAQSGAMLAPYFANTGTAANPHWEPSKNRGPDIYFPAATRDAVILEAARVGLEPHLHADGDRAVHEALDGIEVLRRTFPPQAIRAAIAHDEIVDPADFPRFAKLDAIPVLSMQWEKPAPDTVDGAREYLGPVRYKYMEPASFLADQGARIAYGSDWPVDELNEWFALKVGVTRTNAPDAGPNFAGRLSDDTGLSRKAVLRAITMNGSYELHQDEKTGSLEVGKLADFIVIDRNFFAIPAEQIADIKVLLTVVGGRIVYRSGDK